MNNKKELIEAVSRWFSNPEYFSIADIADYLISHGALMPGVKTGDKIYLVGKLTNEIFEVEVIGMWIYDDEVEIVTDKGIIVSEWYATREEAERVLSSKIREVEK